jgi:hypothetical protein
VALSEGGIPSSNSSNSSNITLGACNSSKLGTQQQQQQQQQEQQEQQHAEQQEGCELPTCVQQQQLGCRVEGRSKHSSLAGTAPAAEAGQAGMLRSRLSEGDLPKLQRQQQQQQAAGKPVLQEPHVRPQSHKQQQQVKQKQQRMQSAYGTAADSGSKAKRHDGLLGWFMRQDKHNKTAPGSAAGSDDGSQTAGPGRREVSSAHSSREAVKPNWSSESTADAVEPWTAASDMEPYQQQQQQQVLGVDPAFGMQPTVAMPTYARGSSHGGSSSRDAAELQRTGSSSDSDSDSSGSCTENALGMPRAPFAPQPPSSSRPAAGGPAPRRLQVAGQAVVL